MLSNSAFLFIHMRAARSHFGFLLQVYGRAVSVPGKAIAGVLSNMKEDVKEESYLRLDEFHKLVVASLKTRPGGVNVSCQFEFALVTPVFIPSLFNSCCFLPRVEIFLWPCQKGTYSFTTVVTPQYVSVSITKLSFCANMSFSRSKEMVKT